MDVVYHPLALPRVAAPLLRYWWHSAPERYARAVLGQSRLIATCLDEHMALAREAEATDLLRPIGWLQLYGTRVGLERAMSRADAARREFGIPHQSVIWETLGALKNDRINRGMRLIASSCASIFSCSFSPRRSGALATPVRFMWLQTSSSGFSSGA